MISVMRRYCKTRNLFKGPLFILFMKIEVNIDKRYFIVIVSLILTFGILLVTNAYNPVFNNPPSEAVNLGHSADEIVVQFNGDEKTIQDVIDILDSNSDGVIDNSETTYVIEWDNVT